MEQPILVVTCDGGIVQNIYANFPCQVKVVDFDCEAYDQDEIQKLKVPEYPGNDEEANVRTFILDGEEDDHSKSFLDQFITP